MSGALWADDTAPLGSRTVNFTDHTPVACGVSRLPTVTCAGSRAAGAGSSSNV